MTSATIFQFMYYKDSYNNQGGVLSYMMSQKMSLIAKLMKLGYYEEDLNNFGSTKT